MKILVVDDEPFMRIVIRECLMGAGYHDVLVTDSAEHAFEVLGITEDDFVSKRLALACILMDIEMPGMNGIDACRRIKSLPEYSDLPIVMVTSMTDENLVRESFEAGAIEYINKPINDLELLARIRSILTFREEITGYKEKENELHTLAEHLRARNDQLQQLASVDEILGLSSKRHLDEQFFVEWRRAIRFGRPLSTIMFDVDHMKAYCYIHGEEAAKACIKKIASALASEKQRSTDIIARCGEDDFLALLPETDMKGAMTVARSIKKLVKELKIEFKKSPLSDYVTVSFGVATIVPNLDAQPIQLLNAARKSLEMAKKAGRDQVKACEIHSVTTSGKSTLSAKGSSKK